MSPLSRSAFAASLLFSLGALLALALGTLHFETAGGAVGYSTPVAVGLMALCLLRILAASYQRGLDIGASTGGAVLAVVASLMFPPFVTLVLLFVPSVSKEGVQSPPAAKLTLLAALPLGIACGLGLLFLVQAVFKAL